MKHCPSCRCEVETYREVPLPPPPLPPPPPPPPPLPRLHYENSPADGIGWLIILILVALSGSISYYLMSHAH